MSVGMRMYEIHLGGRNFGLCSYEIGSAIRFCAEITLGVGDGISDISQELHLRKYKGLKNWKNKYLTTMW